MHGLSYQSSKSVLDSIRSQVKAAEIANEGITLEYESGSRQNNFRSYSIANNFIKFKNKS